MSSNFITPAPPVGVGVFIATPTFQAPVTAYTWSLARTTAELTRRGIPFQLGIPDDVKNVDDGRNALVREFLNGSCTDLLFIDADMRWEPEAVTRILAWDEDVVAGAYRFKSESGDYPVGRIFHADERTGLLAVSYAPTGFMRIRRRVFDKLAPKQRQSGGTKFFFARQFSENSYDGGDVSFCRKWIGEGGKVKVDPGLFFEHVGTKRWGGKFSDYLKDEENLRKHTSAEADYHISARSEDMKAAVEVLRVGRPDEETFRTIADCYGNKPWALSAEGLHTVWRMAINLHAGQTILECGSGVSTLVLAMAARKVGARLVVFEQLGEWAEKTNAVLGTHGLEAAIEVRQIKDSWYDTARLEPLGADLVIIDGPVRSLGGDRLRPFAIPGLLSPTAAVFIDDADEVTTARLNEISGGWTSVEDGPKPMVVGRLGEDAKKAMGQ